MGTTASEPSAGTSHYRRPARPGWP